MNFSTLIKQSNTDEWYTPPEPVRMLVPYLERNGYRKILCPFDKAERNYDAVVSNPPFSKRQKILERLFGSGAPFAMLMNFNGLFDSKARWTLFRDNDFELLVPLGSVHFFNDACPGNFPNFQSVYVCHGMSDKQIDFIGGETDEKDRIG